MEQHLSLNQILGKLRQGQNERLYFDDVIPLFYPGTPLYLKFNSDIKTAFTSAFIEGGASTDESEIR